MKKEDVQIGMKVVPHQKTTWDSLDESVVWRKVRLEGKNYLYVTAWDEEEHCYILNHDPKDLDGGDFFNPEDFEPFNPTQDCTKKLTVEIWSGQCKECEQGEVKYFVALKDTDRGYYWCEHCNAEYDRQMYSLPNAEKIKVVEVEV